LIFASEFEKLLFVQTSCIFFYNLKYYLLTHENNFKNLWFSFLWFVLSDFLFFKIISSFIFINEFSSKYDLTAKKDTLKNLKLMQRNFFYLEEAEILLGYEI